MNSIYTLIMYISEFVFYLHTLITILIIYIYKCMTKIMIIIIFNNIYTDRGELNIYKLQFI